MRWPQTYVSRSSRGSQRRQPSLQKSRTQIRNHAWVAVRRGITSPAAGSPISSSASRPVPPRAKDLHVLLRPQRDHHHAQPSVAPVGVTTVITSSYRRRHAGVGAGPASITSVWWIAPALRPPRDVHAARRGGGRPAVARRRRPVTTALAGTRRGRQCGRPCIRESWRFPPARRLLCYWVHGPSSRSASSPAHS